MESPKRGYDLGTCVAKPKTLAFKKRVAIRSCDLEASLGATASCVQVIYLRSDQKKKTAFWACVAKPTKISGNATLGDALESRPGGGLLSKQDGDSLVAWTC